MDKPLPVVKATRQYSLTQVADLYSEVFSSGEPVHFFLTKEWMTNWLECANAKPLLITFEQNGAILGFVFLGQQNTAFGKIFYVNQTGDQQDDQIWIEYNDIICAKEHQICRLALLEYVSALPACFQFVCNNATDTNWQSSKWREWSIDSIPGFSSNLLNTPISSAFSKNTKSQISRSRSLIEKEMGDITVNWLGRSELSRALENIAKLHIQQWGSHSYGSGFSNTQFVDFHQNLLLNGCNKYALVAEFSAGEDTLGYLYFFLHAKTVYFYLSAINYSIKNNKFKPGLVMHKMALEHFQASGYETYDFLAGYARYKTSLSNDVYELSNLKLYLQKWYFYPIKCLVNVKRRIQSIIHRLDK